MQIRMSDVDIFYFSLDRQPERAEALQKDLKKYKLKKPSKIQAVDREQLNEENTYGYVSDGIGFYHSIAVARSYVKALNAVTTLPSLILEDDARVMNYEPILDIPDDADAIYLGINEFAMEAEDVYAGFDTWKPGFVSFDRSIGNDNFYRIYRSLGCHAILFITDRFLQATKEVFAESARTGIPIDIMQNRLQQQYNCYVAADNFFIQEDTPITYSDLRYYTAPKETPRIGTN